MGQIIGQIESIFSGGTTAVISKVVLLLGIGVAFYFFVRWFGNQEVSAARKAEDEKDVKDKQDLTKQNKQENREAQSDSNAIDDFLKKD